MKNITALLSTIFLVGTVSAQYNIPNTNIYYNSSNSFVGVGVNNPQTGFQVSGHVAATTINSSGVMTGFVQSWADNAIIWKAGNPNAGPAWQDLTKSALLTLTDVYSQRSFKNDGAKEDYAGNLFEHAFLDWAANSQAPPFVGTNLLNWIHSNSIPDILPPGISTVSPTIRKFTIVDAKMTVFQTEIFPPDFKSTPHYDAGYAEIKATDKVVTYSTLVRRFPLCLLWWCRIKL